MNLGQCFYSKLAKYLKKFSKNFFFRKSVILDTIFDFWLALHTLTICLRSCYHVCLRNFYVTCTPFEYQRIGKVQSVIRYPVVSRLRTLYTFNMWLLSLIFQMRTLNTWEDPFFNSCHTRMIKRISINPSFCPIAHSLGIRWVSLK